MREGSPGGSPGRLHNYFPAKEDLFFDRSKGLIDRLSRFVRARHTGESAAVAVLRELAEEVESVSPKVGLIEGYDRFMKVVQGSATLQARLWHYQREQYENLEATLRQETGAADADPLPGLVAGQINWVHQSLMTAITREMIAGRKPAAVSREALVLLDEMADLLSEKVLNYAVRADG